VLAELQSSSNSSPALEIGFLTPALPPNGDSQLALPGAACGSAALAVANPIISKKVLASSYLSAVVVDFISGPCELFTCAELPSCQAYNACLLLARFFRVLPLLLQSSCKACTSLYLLKCSNECHKYLEMIKNKRVSIIADHHFRVTNK
jgi:hypothetical protein